MTLFSQFNFHIHRLHNETNCGKHRSWSCIQCNLLTEDAFKAHMEIQHKFESDDDDAFVIPKLEISLNVIENVGPTENTVKVNTNCVGGNNFDPLLLLVKGEPYLGAESQNVQSISGKSVGEIKVYSSEEEVDER